MKVRRLIWLISLAILGSVLSLVDSNHQVTSANLGLRADGTGPVPPPPPWSPGPKSSSSVT